MMCAKRIYTDIDHFQKCHLFTKGYKYSEIQFIYNIEKTYISELSPIFGENIWKHKIVLENFAHTQISLCLTYDYLDNKRLCFNCLSTNCMLIVK